jgi:hypothetical protein
MAAPLPPQGPQPRDRDRFLETVERARAFLERAEDIGDAAHRPFLLIEQAGLARARADHPRSS